MQPKPNPETQARVDAADGPAIAKQKADDEEMTLAHWYAMARTAGAKSIRFDVVSQGISIIIQGNRGSKHVEAQVLAPKGQPFVLYACMALAEFRAADEAKKPYTPPTVTEVTKEEAAMMLEDNNGVVKGLPPMFEGLEKVNPDYAAQQKAEIAAEQERRAQAHVKHGDILKPPPAGAGRRKPLGLPLCINCNAQPVMRAGAQFCGARCAQEYHMKKAARATGAKVPK